MFLARVVQSLLLILALTSLAGRSAIAQTAQNYQLDQDGSQRLTRYLHKHRLPVVGAQILDHSDGSRELHLFGFTATDFGKQDAERKALKWLGDPSIRVVNSIQVNPSIEKLRSSHPEASAPAAMETPAPPPSDPNTEWDNAIDNIYKNGAQPLPQPSGPLLP